jgi:hypothetical protein
MTARLSAEQRRALELLAREPRGITGHLLEVMGLKCSLESTKASSKVAGRLRTCRCVSTS